MYVIREVLRCTPGKVRQMVTKFQAISKELTKLGHEPLRVMTDVTGEPFWTIVAEAKVPRVDGRPRSYRGGTRFFVACSNA